MLWQYWASHANKLRARVRGKRYVFSRFLKMVKDFVGQVIPAEANISFKIINGGIF